MLYPEITDDGAERAIYLTWPAGRLLLPAADLFRKHVIRTVSAGRIRPVALTAGQAEQMAKDIKACYSQLEIEVVDGSQPHYAYILSAE